MTSSHAAPVLMGLVTVQDNRDGRLILVMELAEVRFTSRPHNDPVLGTVRVHGLLNIRDQGATTY